MKKIIVCFALAAIAASPAFAGDSSKKTADGKAKAECPATACAGAKSACSKSVSKQSILSPKAAENQKTVAQAK